MARPFWRTGVAAVCVTVLSVVAALAIVAAPTATASEEMPTGYYRGGDYTSVVANPNGPGYWTMTDGQGVTAHGGAPFFGSPPSKAKGTIVATRTGQGYWVVDARNGTVYAYGDATALPNFPAASGYVAGDILISVAPTGDDRGLLAVDVSGRVWTIGDAVARGDAKGKIGVTAFAAGIATTPTGNGLLDHRHRRWGLLLR